MNVQRLSQREFQVMCKLALGHTVTRIARDLGFSVKTASTYRTRMFKKMGFNTNTDLVIFALKNGLIIEAKS